MKYQKILFIYLLTLTSFSLSLSANVKEVPSNRAIYISRLYAKYPKEPLIGVSKGGNIKGAKLLLEEGEDVNSRNDLGETALMYAVRMGGFEMFKFLLEAGADVNIADDTGDTALMDAVKNGNLEMFKLLLEAGADVNIADDTGNTVLMDAVINENLEAFKLLLEAEADVDNNMLEYVFNQGGLDMNNLDFLLNGYCADYDFSTMLMYLCVNYQKLKYEYALPYFQESLPYLDIFVKQFGDRLKCHTPRSHY